MIKNCKFINKKNLCRVNPFRGELLFCDYTQSSDCEEYKEDTKEPNHPRHPEDI